MIARCVRFTKFRKYRAPALSVLLHVTALMGIFIKFENSQDTSQIGLAPVAIALVAESEVPALPPWPTANSWHTPANGGAETIESALSGNVPLLQTSNNFAQPDALPVQLASELAASPLPQQIVSKPLQAAYGHFDASIFAIPEPAKPNANGHNETTNHTASPSYPNQLPSLTGLPGNGVSIDEFLKGHFRVRIVTTKDNAYLVVEIIDGNPAMRGLLDETARHYRTSARYAEGTGTYSGSFTAPVLAALP